MIQLTPELRRIASIPEREYTKEQGETIAEYYNAHLRRHPHIDWKLHAHQAIPLHEIATYGGGFFQVFAGGGKTLTTFLAPIVLGADRPVLLTLSGLVGKTHREAAEELSPRYNICSWLKVVGYSALSRTTYYAEHDPITKLPNPETGLLERLDPDLLLLDEMHALSNPRSAMTKRLLTFLRARRKAGRPVRVAGFSGTITDHSVLDYWHIAQFTTRSEWLWFPRHHTEAEEWHKCIDRELVDPGALVPMLRAESEDIRHVRQAYGHRMRRTPSVYITTDEKPGASLEFDDHPIEEDAAVNKAFAELRQHWRMPDGWTLEDAPVHWMAADCMSLGFYMAPKERPPEEWANKRLAWAQTCRHVLTHNLRHLDSELDVTNSVLAGNEGQEALEIYSQWVGVRDLYELKSKLVMVSDVGVRTIKKLLARSERPMLVWVNRNEWGELLAQECGSKYFSGGGFAKDGTYIEDHDKGHAILSFGANKAGRNLQYKWADNLLAMCTPPAKHMEQLIARTHRPHQKQDTVRLTWLVGCLEHVAAIDKAIQNALYQRDTTHTPQRLLYGNVTRKIFPPATGIKYTRWSKEREAK